MEARQAPPTSCVDPGQAQLLVVEPVHKDPVGVAQTQPVEPYPATVDVEPEGHAVQGGCPEAALK